jgi:hypothetical protein
MSDWILAVLSVSLPAPAPPPAVYKGSSKHPLPLGSTSYATTTHTCLTLKKFWTNFTEMYKQHPALWNTKRSVVTILKVRVMQKCL